jgi:hypothetical protein
MEEIFAQFGANSAFAVTLIVCCLREIAFEKLARGKEKTNCSSAQLSSSSYFSFAGAVLEGPL